MPVPVPTPLLAWIAAWSVITFTACVADKRRAHRHRRRVPEGTLLALAFIGGTPGLLAGMLVARHKTRKSSFIARLVVVVLAQVVLLWIALLWGVLPGA